MRGLTAFGRIRSYIATAKAHGIALFTAMRDAFLGDGDRPLPNTTRFQLALCGLATTTSAGADVAVNVRDHRIVVQLTSYRHSEIHDWKSCLEQRCTSLTKPQVAVNNDLGNRIEFTTI